MTMEQEAGPYNNYEISGQQIIDILIQLKSDSEKTAKEADKGNFLSLILEFPEIFDQQFPDDLDLISGLSPEDSVSRQLYDSETYISVLLDALIKKSLHSNLSARTYQTDEPLSIFQGQEDFSMMKIVLMDLIIQLAATKQIGINPQDETIIIPQQVLIDSLEIQLVGLDEEIRGLYLLDIQVTELLQGLFDQGLTEESQLNSLLPKIDMISFWERYQKAFEIVTEFTSRITTPPIRK